MLKTHEVFFIGLVTATAVKNQKKTQDNEKDNDTKQHKKLKNSKLQNNYLSTVMYHTLTLTLLVVGK